MMSRSCLKLKIISLSMLLVCVGCGTLQHAVGEGIKAGIESAKDDRDIGKAATIAGTTILGTLIATMLKAKNGDKE